MRGRFYDGVHAESREVSFRIDDGGVIHVDPALIGSLPLADVVISPRLGNVPRTLRFPSDALIETTDHDELDAALAAQKVYVGWVHRLESSWRYIIMALVVVGASVVAGAIWGIPWLSTRIAYELPSEVSTYIGSGTLETLDRRIFEPSELDDARKSELSRLFAEHLPDETGGIPYRLVFRGGGFIGANAFALPDGTVIVTDELVEIAGSDDEILAVMLHEMGHVEHRHSLRLVIGHSMLAMLTLVIAGDLNSAGTLVVAMPSVLVESSYSRELEREADVYALQRMKAAGIDPNHFANFLEQFETGITSQGEPRVERNTSLECPSPEGRDGDRRGSWASYLSSHPASRERIAMFREAAAR